MGAEGNKYLVLEFMRVFLRGQLYLDTPDGLQCQNENTALGSYATEFKS